MTIGDNCLILPGANIQPHCKIEDNTFIWNDALIGHHSLIKKCMDRRRILLEV